MEDREWPLSWAWEDANRQKNGKNRGEDCTEKFGGTVGESGFIKGGGLVMWASPSVFFMSYG